MARTRTTTGTVDMKATPDQYQVGDWVLCEKHTNLPWERGRVIKVHQWNSGLLEVLVQFEPNTGVWFYPYELELDNEQVQARLV